MVVEHVVGQDVHEHQIAKQFVFSVVFVCMYLISMWKSSLWNLPLPVIVDRIRCRVSKAYYFRRLRDYEVRRD